MTWTSLVSSPRMACTLSTDGLPGWVRLAVMCWPASARKSPNVAVIGSHQVVDVPGRAGSVLARRSQLAIRHLGPGMIQFLAQDRRQPGDRVGGAFGVFRQVALRG